MRSLNFHIIPFYGGKTPKMDITILNLEILKHNCISFSDVSINS